MIFSLQYWKNTAELVIRGAAIAAVTAMGGSVIDAWHLDWKTVGGMAASGAILSLLTSLSSATVGEKGSPLVTRIAEAPGHGWNPVDPLGD